ncbi:hypothetical protein XHV734_1657 [Xanthomonas hortorum pv. vitians]|nr:hypothetical protein XHV734_1657 [Xanthomonas hortorum pv. vitians]
MPDIQAISARRDRNPADAAHAAHPVRSAANVRPGLRCWGNDKALWSYGFLKSVGAGAQAGELAWFTAIVVALLAAIEDLREAVGPLCRILHVIAAFSARRHRGAATALAGPIGAALPGTLIALRDATVRRCGPAESCGGLAWPEWLFFFKRHRRGRFWRVVAGRKQHSRCCLLLRCHTLAEADQQRDADKSEHSCSPGTGQYAEHIGLSLGVAWPRGRSGRPSSSR